MTPQMLLKKKHVLLKNELSENLQKKHDLELRITEQFEELKKLEIALEKSETHDSSAGITASDPEPPRESNFP